MGDSLVQTGVRLTQELKDNISELAWRERKSMNQWIVEQLEIAVQGRLSSHQEKE